MPKKFIKLAKVAEKYDVERSTLVRWCAFDKHYREKGTPEDGKFNGKARKVGGLWYVPITEIERLFEGD